MIKKSILYIILKRIPAEAYRSHRSSHSADNLVIFNKTPSKCRIKTTANLLKLEKNDRAKVAITYPLLSKNITTLARYLRSWCRITAETLSVFKQSNRTLASTDFSGTQYEMTAQKEQKKPSFPLILSVLSIVFYCAGFLRVELDLKPPL